MGTIQRFFNKIFFKSKETEKEIKTVKQDIKSPKDKLQRAFKPSLTINPVFSHCNPEFHPKRTKLKGYQKENMRKK